VISPYARPAYVFNETSDFISVLRFMEKLYGTPSLGRRDQTANDLIDTFDFTQRPNPPLILEQRDCSKAT